MNMENVKSIIENRALLCAVCSWCVAQVLKTIIYAIVNRSFDIRRMFGDGGMPSGHSATVTSLATCIGIEYGFSSPLFGIAAILAIIVMHDARGIRLEAGKHAQMINNMMDEFMRMFNPEIEAEVRLKEFLGHTPLQVFFGAILGIIVAIVFCMI